MTRTRWSLLYPITVLLSSGLLLIIVPQWVPTLLLSTAEYGTVFPRMLGIMFIGLGSLVSLVVWYQVEVIYFKTVWIRLFFWMGFAGMYVSTEDRMFLTLLGILSGGIVLTLWTAWQDRMNPIYTASRYTSSHP